jgi:hypothetical protein
MQSLPKHIQFKITYGRFNPNKKNETHYLILFRPHLKFCHAILIGLFVSIWYGNVTVVKVYDHAEKKTCEVSHVIILHVWLREWMWTDLWM